MTRMIATTINSSMSEKPDCFRKDDPPPFLAYKIGAVCPNYGIESSVTQITKVIYNLMTPRWWRRLETGIIVWRVPEQRDS